MFVHLYICVFYILRCITTILYNLDVKELVEIQNSNIESQEYYMHDVFYLAEKCTKLFRNTIVVSKPDSRIMLFNNHDTIWIISIFSLLSRTQILEEITGILGLITFIISFSNDDVLLATIDSYLNIILNKSANAIFFYYTFDYFIPTEYKYAFKNKFDKIFINGISSTTNYDINFSNDVHLIFFTRITIYIFSLSNFNGDAYFNDNSITITNYCARLLLLKEIGEFLILAVLNFILHSNESLLLKVENLPTERFVLETLGYQMISGVSISNKTERIKIIKSLLKVKLTLTDNCEYVYLIICFYVENISYRSSIIKYFLVEDEYELLLFLMETLFSKRMKYNIHLRLALITFLSKKNIEHCILQLYNIYICEYDILKIFMDYFLDYVENPSEKIKSFILETYDLFYKIITDINIFNLNQIPTSEENIKKLYVCTENGLFLKKHNTIKFDVYTRKYKIIMVKNDKSFIIDLRSIYLYLLMNGHAFLRMFGELEKLMRKNIVNKLGFLMFLQIYSIKIILYKELKNLGYDIYEYINNINQIYIAMLYNNILRSDFNEYTDFIKYCINVYYKDIGYFGDIFKDDDKIETLDELQSIMNKRYYFKCITIIIENKNILENSIEQLNNYIGIDMKLPLVNIFIFDGTIGEGIGVFYNWIQNIAHGIVFLDFYLLYETKNYKYVPWLKTGLALVNQKRKLKFVGQIIGLCIRNNTIFPIEFEDFVYDELSLGKSNVVSFVEKEYKERLKNIAHISTDEDIETYFQITCVDYDNEYILKDILFIDYMYKPIDIIHYKNFFVSKVIQNYKNSLSLIKEGLLQVINVNVLLSIAHCNKLKDLVCGNQSIDVEDWKKITKMNFNLEKQKKTASLFWEYIESIDQEKRKLILKIWTGISHLRLLKKDDKQPMIYIGNLQYSSVFASACTKTIYLPYCQNFSDIKNYMENSIANNKGEGFDAK